MTKEISTVGEMRAALEGVSDDTPLRNQVVAADGTVGYMHMTVGDIPGSHPLMMAVSLRHPELLSMRFASTVEPTHECERDKLNPGICTHCGKLMIEPVAKSPTESIPKYPCIHCGREFSTREMRGYHEELCDGTRSAQRT